MLKKVCLFCVLGLGCVVVDALAADQTSVSVLATKGYVDSAVQYVTGVVPDSYTKSETDNLLASKADVSVADTIATTRPSGTPAAGRAFIWVSEN